MRGQPSSPGLLAVLDGARVCSHRPSRIKMQLRTHLNRIEKHKGFVYSNVGFNKNVKLEIEVPFWSIAEFLVYAIRVIDYMEWD